ncbi:hypothetical protein BRC81_10290 [Halobacteriales archaeon QS_1_68_20]|nr:MAG: hypothetical protein BRC81_10290 [Halobacteriales archaeon QS_1_68_20]
MPAGRYFRALTVFDLMGNFFPGIVLVTALLVTLSSPPFPSSPGEYLLAGIAALSLGHFV